MKINGGCELRKTGAIRKSMKGVNVNSGGVIDSDKKNTNSSINHTKKGRKSTKGCMKKDESEI